MRAQECFDPNVNGRNVSIGFQEIGLRLLVGVRDHVKVTTEGHHDLGKFFPYGGLVHRRYALFIAAMTLNGIRAFAVEAVAGTLSLEAVAIAPFAAAFLLWILKLLVTELYQLMQKKPVTVVDPPKIDSDPVDPGDP